MERLPRHDLVTHPQEFCVAMHFVGRVRKGLPLPDLPNKAVQKKQKKRKTKAPTTVTSKPNEADVKRKTVAEKSPRRRSRLASLVECQEPQGDNPRTLTPTTHELSQGQVQYLCFEKALVLPRMV